MYPRLNPIAALLALSFAPAAFAVDQLAALDPVLITATRQEMRASELLADVSVIDRKEIERNGQGTITELLARQPGIQTASNGGPGTSTNFYIRGARPDQTKVLIDGIPINSVDLSGSPLRFVPLADVERIEILRGPAATLYGADAVGGVIQIFTKRGEPGLRANGFVGYGTQNTAQVSAGLSGGNEQWRFRLEGNHQSSDSISARRNASNKDADRDPYRNTGGAASLSFLPAKGHEIGLSYRRNEGKTYYDSSSGTSSFDSRVLFESEQWQVFTKNRILDNWNSKLHYGEAVDYQNNFYSGAPANGDYLRTVNKQLGWQNDVKLPLGSALISLERQDQSVTPRTSFAADSEVSINSVVAGWMANYDIHRWQISGRHDDHSQFGTADTYALAYGLQLAKQWRAHVSYGTAFKAPSLYQLFDQYSGNPLLQAEKAKNQEAALIWDSGSQTVSATYYQNRIENLIDWSFSTFKYENVSRAQLEGLTLAYQARLDDWTIGASADFLDAKNEDTGMKLGRRAGQKATLWVSRRIGAFDVGGEFMAVDKRFNSNTETGQMDAYTLTNLTGRYAITKELAIEGRINNVFDKQYETALGYGTFGRNAFIGLRYSPK
ncbi:MAG: TonB-dependent receptor [Dechloromonas sp.]|nr:TonB-dependent receptor [Dechloromonas sp.]